MKRLRLLLFFWLCLIPIIGLAQTNVSGAISSNTTWNSTGSPYRVTGNLLVNSGVTLTVLPGTVVEIYSGKSIQILGELIAIGTPQDSIYFKDYNPQSSFKSIEFGDSSSDVVFSTDGSYASGNILKYVTINGGGSGANGSVIFASSTGLIRHSSIRNSKSSGIHIYKNTTHVNTGWMGSGGVNKYVTVDSSNVSNNTSSGFNCACYQYNVAISLKYNKFNSNGSSGFTSGGGDGGGTHEFIVIGNEFKSNNGKGYEGLTNGNQWVLENNIAENGSDGIRVRGNGTYRIRKNIIRDNNGRGVHGIYASIIVDSNVIYNNILGIEASQGGDFKIRNNQILNNNSIGSSGIYASGFDPICSNEQKAWSTSVLLKRNSFVNNSSDSGLIAIHNPDYGSPAFLIDSNNIGANHKKYIIYNSRNFSSANAIAPNYNFFNGNTASSIGDSIKDWNLNGNLSTVSPSNISQIPVTFAPTLPVKRAIIYPGTPNYIVFSANKSSAFNNYRLYRGDCLYEDFSTDSSMVTHFNVDSLSYYKVTVRSNTALGCEDFFTGNESYYFDDIRLPFQIIGNSNFCFEDTPTFTIQKNNVIASQATYYIHIQLNNSTLHTDTINPGSNIFSWSPVSTLRNDSTYSLTVSSPSFGYTQSISFKLSKKSLPNIVYTELAICSNTTATLSAPNSFSNVKWYRLQWGTAQNVANGSSYSASPGYSYYFTSTSPEGCIAYSDTVVVSTVNLPGASAIPAITSSVPLSYCSGSTFNLNYAVPSYYIQTYPINNLSPPSVRWYRNDTLLSQTTYTYSSSAQNFSITDSVPGTYEIRIGSSTCYAPAQITLTEKPNVDITVVSNSNNTCFGDSGGQIIVSSPNANSYAWSSPALSNIPNNDTITNLPAGLYTLTATRSNGCAKTIQIQITEPPQIQLTSTSSPVSCNGGSDGELYLTVSNAVPPYSISWSSTSSANDTLGGLTAGSYTATVVDSNLCTNSAQFTVTQPAAIAVQVLSTTNVSCYSGVDGATIVGVTGGNGSYTSSWRSVGGTSILSTSTSLSGVPMGTYRYKVVDLKGCSDSVDVTITQPAAPLSVAINSHTDVLCYGASTGSLGVAAAGGTQGTGYQYLWQNSSGSTVGSSAVVNGLPAGVYTCLVTDTKGCSTSITDTLLQPASAVSLTSNGTSNVSCFGGNNGLAWVNPIGGTPPYSYSWNNGNSNDTASNLVAGSYTVTVTDNNNCVYTQGYTITQPTLLINSYTKSSYYGNTNVSCPGGLDGSIDLTPSGGTPPYSYSWSTGSISQDLSGVGAGSYSCTITDFKGCTSIATVTMTEPTAFTWNNTITDVTCNGLQNGSIVTTITGGNAPYAVDWSSSANKSNKTEVTFRVDLSQQSISTLGIGAVIQGQVGVLGLTDLYGDSVFIGNKKFNPGDTIYWRYFNGSNAETVPIACGAITSLSVFERYLIVPDHDTILPIVCFSSCIQCNGTVGNGMDGTIQTTSKTLNNLGAGNYTFNLVDRNGCLSSQTVSVIEPSSLLLTSSSLDPTCPQNADGEMAVVGAGGTAPYTYLWSTGSTNDTVVNASKGTYWVYVSDANGCADTVHYSLTAPEPFDFEEICVLSVDSATGKNLIVWDKTANKRTSDYVILKENAQGQFVQVGTQPYVNLSVYADLASNPQAQPDRYKLALIDSCGNYSDTSDYHRTIHLQSNLGTTGDVNLTWTGYEGKPVQSYELWRWVTAGNLVQIATVAASVTSYTDQNPPVAPNVYYVVNAIFPSNCSPTSGKTTAFDVSKSNILNQTGISIDENWALKNVKVYPNPNAGIFTIEFINGFEAEQISIVDGVGRIIRDLSTHGETTISVDLSNEPKGVYRISIRHQNGQSNLPIVVQ
jgi:hypothetical protein